MNQIKNKINFFEYDIMDILDTLFGPVSKKYCGFFYYYSVICFLFYIMAVTGSIMYGVKHNKGPMFYFTAFIATGIYAIGYFQNRLLFSMCTR
jgi:hypothetical protein